jgi:cytochrome P450 family 12
MRSATNPILMKPRLVKSYIPLIDEIVNDFIQIIPKIQHENGEMPANFHEFLNRWTLESITAITLEKRLGLMDIKTEESNGIQIQRAIRKILNLAGELERKPSVWKVYRTTTFKELMRAYDDLTE